MKKLLTKAAMLAILGVTTPASALTTINFENMLPTPWHGFLILDSYTESNVEFTTVNGDEIVAVEGVWPYTTPNRTVGLQGGWLPVSIRADIGVEANYVSVDLGDLSDDMDRLFLKIYSADGRLLGQQWDELPLNAVDMIKTLKVTATEGFIGYAVFGGIDADGNSSVIADNFTYGVIPAPGALLLGITGLAWVQGLRRKRLL